MTKITQRLDGIDSHIRVLIAMLVAAAVCACLFARSHAGPLVIVTWDTFAVADLGLAWIHILLANPMDCLKSAKLQDTNRTFIFFFVIASAFASLFAIGFLLKGGRELSAGKLTEHVMLVILTVLVSWFLIHTVFSLRYAHIFYGKDEHVERNGEKTALDFPGKEDPDYLDFAYFSFIIGMTCQVSDVQIQSRRVRKLALIHGLLAFFFNTVIVALSINMVSSLL